MLPYAFSALTMKSVGAAANKMVQEIRKQFLALRNTGEAWDDLQGSRRTRIVAWPLRPRRP